LLVGGRTGTISIMNGTEKTLEELRKLPIEERIQLVEDLWDSIADETEGCEFPVSPELARDLDERLRQYRNDASSARSADEVVSKIRRLLSARS
jgi:putative addiction module component (TIGR02574 family)